jgi:hypothetical protein
MRGDTDDDRSAATAGERLILCPRRLGEPT